LKFQAKSRENKPLPKPFPQGGTHYRQITASIFPGLKGQYNSAQGNALGKGVITKTVRGNRIINEKFLSDGIERHHLYENRYYLIRPKCGVLFYDRYRADDFQIRSQTQGVAVRLNSRRSPGLLPIVLSGRFHLDKSSFLIQQKDMCINPLPQREESSSKHWFWFELCKKSSEVQKKKPP
jgi:hypothetical protein